jgi:beta-ketoacyl-acyl-carrier-protein synthase II
MNNPRVVITGLGAITPLGSSVESYWSGLLAGKSGIRRITLFDPSKLPCQIAGEVPDFDPHTYMDRKEARRMPRSAQLALAAAVQARDNAGLPEKMPDPERAGVVFGTAIGGIERIEEGILTVRDEGTHRVNPFILPSGIPNLSAFQIARQFQCLGPNSTITTACAASTQSIGEATALIRRGAADIVITGGTESALQEYTLAGFSAMRALPVNYNHRPEAASRPFDADREGFIFSEGAGALVLESLDHAREREARIYGEVIGHASSQDGFHLAAPHPAAAGPVRAMRWALEDSGIPCDEVDYINAHGSSTPLNDSTETQAIKTLFGDHAFELAVSSTKSMIGHPMGASGALEAIACVLAIFTGEIPPTINYETPDPECDLDYVPNESRKMAISVALSNSFGLGGQNACLVLKAFSEP